MKRIGLRVDVDVDELVNVPLNDGTKCYMVCNISNDILKNNHKLLNVNQFKSNDVEVKNHRVKFNNGNGLGKYKDDVKVIIKDDGTIDSKWINISFHTKRNEHNHDELLGILNINLNDINNNNDTKMLLEKSKTNTIVKLRIGVYGEGYEPKIREVKNRKSGEGINYDKDNYNDKDNDKIVNMKSELETQNMMNKACELAITDSSLLDKLSNRTYRFTWQLKSSEYEEFTPAECVKDIIEHNGNGWKKNDEGVDYIDIIERERGQVIQDKVGNRIDDRLFSDDDEFDSEYESGGDDNSDGDDDYNDNNSEYGYDYNDGRRYIDKYSHSVRQKPVTEAEVREDLRSWKISV